MLCLPLWFFTWHMIRHGLKVGRILIDSSFVGVVWLLLAISHPVKVFLMICCCFNLWTDDRIDPLPPTLTNKLQARSRWQTISMNPPTSAYSESSTASEAPSEQVLSVRIGDDGHTIYFVSSAWLSLIKLICGMHRDICRYIFNTYYEIAFSICDLFVAAMFTSSCVYGLIYD